jgi:hypothetical protein
LVAAPRAVDCNATYAVDAFANVAAALLKRAAHRDGSMEQGQLEVSPML